MSGGEDRSGSDPLACMLDFWPQDRHVPRNMRVLYFAL